MFNLHEFTRRTRSLSDLLPWAALLAPGIVVNKDGSFQATLRYRGPDIDSALDSERLNLTAHVNQALMNLGEGWAVYVECNRHLAPDYPGGEFSNPLALAIDLERRDGFQGHPTFKTAYYITLQFLPPHDRDRMMEDYIVEAEREAKKLDRSQDLEIFRKAVSGFMGLLLPYFKELDWLDDEALLTYLHSTISPKGHKIAVPDIPMHLDAYLHSATFLPGLKPELGGQHLRVLTVKAFPAEVFPQILDSLNAAPFAFRQVTRFIFLSKDDAEQEITSRQKKWFASRKSFRAMVSEFFTQQESRFVNEEAVGKTMQLDAAKMELGTGRIAYGYMTVTAVVLHAEEAEADRRISLIENILNVAGFPAFVETVNATEAWLSSLPGLARPNIRRPLLSSVNLARIMPTSAVWAGTGNLHLGGPPLLRAVTNGSTPFDLSTHVGDIGHCLIVGPTGAGKSTLLAFMALQHLRYKNARVIAFDKGGSIKAATYGVKGDFYDIGSVTGPSFQPLRHMEDDQTRVWAQGWILMLLEQENLKITPAIKELVWDCLLQLGDTAPEHRTLSSFMTMIQDSAVRDAIRPYTADGAFGHLLDAAHDDMTLTDWQAFEMEEIMKMGRVLPAVLAYLFHLIERQLTPSTPTMIILDEAWVFLDNIYFETVIREWLKVLRKKNAFVIFATQNLVDFAASAVGPVISGNVPTRLYLPNADAEEPAARRFYGDMGLNSQQISVLARATPKRHYYLSSPLGNRLFELGLSELSLAFCGASGDETGEIIDQIQNSGEDFATEYCRHLGIDWAVEFMTEYGAEYSTEEIP
tara:strand:+ start:11648 stop:14074 length:2427 start_codon:yes stop_codon:yes gene_type:complete